MKNENEVFEAAFARTMSHEGGYVDSAFDVGGETKYGISKTAYPDLDIASLTPDDAKKIYFKDFWIKQKLGLIESPIIATKIFDLTINMGAFGGGLVVQQALHDLDKIVIMDGIIGIETVTAINSCNPIIYTSALIGRACAKYCAIYDKFVSDSKSEDAISFYRNCLKSWLRRTLEV